MASSDCGRPSGVCAQDEGPHGGEGGVGGVHGGDVVCAGGCDLEGVLERSYELKNRGRRRGCEEDGTCLAVGVRMAGVDEERG